MKWFLFRLLGVSAALLTWLNAGSGDLREYGSRVSRYAAEAGTAARQERLAAEAESRGSYGRLRIGVAGIDVAVFFTEDLYGLQALVDAEDSACMFHWYDGSTVIADHDYQGFRALSRVRPGCRAMLETPDGVSVYVCKELIPDGLNTGSALTYRDGTPVAERHRDCLLMYTCNDDGSITVAVWE